MHQCYYRRDTNSAQQQMIPGITSQENTQPVLARTHSCTRTLMQHAPRLMYYNIGITACISLPAGSQRLARTGPQQHSYSSGGVTRCASNIEKMMITQWDQKHRSPLHSAAAVSHSSVGVAQFASELIKVVMPTRVNQPILLSVSAKWPVHTLFASQKRGCTRYGASL